MNWLNILTLIGSLGLFLYGLQMMSEGLQKITADSIRKMLSGFTRNRVTGMFAGFLLTLFVQSSSATTVMLVSFVNAGILTVAQSMAAIMGANVGTTALTWLIAILGYKVQFSLFVLPLIAISLPFFNSRKTRNNSWAEFIFGFAMLFFGLQQFTEALPSSAEIPSFISSLDAISSLGFCSICIFLLLGILLTVIVQASTATFIISLALCFNGWIPFSMGCAMILGSNIGTCVTPLWASHKANTMAKRAAVGHLVFNLIGVIWSLIILDYFCEFIDWLCISFHWESPTLPENSPLGLALFHTLFNAINLCLLLPFNKQIVGLITRLTPEKKQQDETFKLQHIDSGFMSSSGELALVQVQKEVANYANDIYKMFDITKKMLSESMGSDRQLEMMDRVNAMEEDSDSSEIEIAQFLNRISPKTLSLSGEQISRNLYKIVDELESIADSIRHCSNCLYQKSEQHVKFSPEMNTNVGRMVSLVDTALLHMVKVLEADEVPSNALNRAYNYEDEINNFRNQLRNEMLDSIESKAIEFEQNTFFMHLINEFEKIGDYIINIIAAASEK